MNLNNPIPNLPDSEKILDHKGLMSHQVIQTQSYHNGNSLLKIIKSSHS